MTWSTKQTATVHNTRLDKDREPVVAYFTERAVVEMSIEVDWNELAKYFAGKLAKGKGGVSRIQNGAIIARRISVKKSRI